MKRMWVSLLAMLLVILTILTGAIAETNDEIELDTDSEEMDVFVEPVDEVVPEEVELAIKASLENVYKMENEYKEKLERVILEINESKNK